MSTTTKNDKPPAPVLIVFGTPKGARAPHGAWFPAPFAERARVAAQRQNLATLAVDTEPTRAAAAILKEGQLKAGGQLMMPCITQEMLSRLRRLLSQALPPFGATTNGVVAGAQVPRDLWDKLKPTDVVLAADLDKAGEPDGWYEATIMKIEDGVYVIRWVYEPELGFLRLQRQHIALMYPG
jgi:hypothetical protein